MRAGETITVCTGDVLAYTAASKKLVATMLATIIAAPERDGLNSDI